MEYIVIEYFNGTPSLVCTEDGVTIFNNLQLAKVESANCQNGIIVPLIDMLPLLEESRRIMSSLTYSDTYYGEDEVVEQINKIL